MLVRRDLADKGLDLIRRNAALAHLPANIDLNQDCLLYTSHRNGLSRSGMDKVQFFGMQQLSFQGVTLLFVAIGRISNHRMANMRHMHADLVRSPGLQAAFH